jgi:O-antigen ligase
MTRSFLEAARSRLSKASSVAVVGLGLTIPISTTADSVMLVTILAASLAASQVKDRLLDSIRHPGTLAWLAFFLLVALGTLHGSAPVSDRLHILTKYDDFLLPLLFLPILADAEAQRQARWAFGLAMGATLILSLALAAGWLPAGGWVRGQQHDASIFKLRITHSLFMSFAAFMFAMEAGRQRETWKRVALWTLVALAGLDVFLFVQSQTGQVGFLALVVYWCWRRLGLKGIPVGVFAGIIVLTMSLQVSPMFRDRMETVVEQVQSSPNGALASTSQPVAVSLRLEWYKNTLALVAAHPLSGVGTGGFARAYERSVVDPAAVKPSHPHNQYLLTAAELGVFGLAGLLALFAWLFWLSSQVSDSFYKEIGQGALILMATGCLFNSLLLDHAEGLFFVWIMCVALAGHRTGSRAAAC